MKRVRISFVSGCGPGLLEGLAELGGPGLLAELVVLALVLGERAPGREDLAAGGAVVRTLIGVNALVGREIPDPREALAAMGALVGLLAGVDPLVASPVAVLRELHRTVGATVRLFAGVDPLVAVPVAQLAEALVALACGGPMQPTPSARHANGRRADAPFLVDGARAMRRTEAYRQRQSGLPHP